MNPFPSRRGRFRMPWRTRDEIEREVDEELSFHLDMRTEELVSSGSDPEAARAQARREFGDVEAARMDLNCADRSREQRRSRSAYLHNLAMDLRHAARSFRSDRGSTVAAVLALALGIAAVTTVFSLVNWVLVRPVAGVSTPSQLVRVQMRDDGGDETGVSYPNFVDLKAAPTGLLSLAGYDDIGLQIGGGDSPPIRAMAAVVAGDYFGVLGVRPFAGRFFSPAEHSSVEPVMQVVVSHHVWRTVLAGDPSVVGRRLRLNGLEFTVIGVAPEGFRGTERLANLDAWLPLSAYPALTRDANRSLTNRKQGFLREFVGRLAPGATPSMAENRLRSAMATLVETYPEQNEKFSYFLPTVFEGIGLSAGAQQHVRSTLRLMLGIVGVLLLIAWANVGNLLILRGLRRRGETAVRQALGASRTRLFQGHLAAGFFLAASGGAAGVLIAVLGMRLLRGKLLAWLPEIERVELDWRVLVFVLGLTLTTALVVSILPNWGAHSDLAGNAVREGTRGSTHRAGALRGALVASQVALATVLIACGLLLARTLSSLNRVEVGFDPERVLVFDIDVSLIGYDTVQNALFRTQLRERLEGVPGVEFVALASGYPFGSAMMQRVLHAADAPDAKPVHSWEFTVSRDYFSTLGIRLLSGRGLAEGPSSGSEVVIGRTLARNLFGDADPLGKQVSAPQADGSRTTHTVVGVAEDIRVHDVRAPQADAVLYRSLSALDPEWSGTAVLVRYAPSVSRPAALSTVQHIVAEIEPSLAIWHAAPLSQMLADTIREERLLARMALILAGLAGLLAAVGLYAVVAYSIAQRTREIGIRLALGAQVTNILAAVGTDAALVVGSGVAAGIAGAALLSRLLESRLFGVERLDPLVYLAAGLAFTIAAAIALWQPLRTAVKVSPARALRQE